MSDDKTVRIAWRIDGTSGVGLPIDAELAAIWVDLLNYVHGEGTHWIDWSATS